MTRDELEEAFEKRFEESLKTKAEALEIAATIALPEGPPSWQSLPNHASCRIIGPVATTTMNISLPDALRDFVEEEVTARGYTSASEYVRELVRERKSKKELEAKLLSALESEDLGQLAPEFFEDLREKVRRKAGQRGT